MYGPAVLLEPSPRQSMLTEGERTATEQPEILSLHDAAVWLENLEGLNYHRSVAALVGAVSVIPAAPKYSLKPLRFDAAKLRLWVAHNREKIRHARQTINPQ
jgi:hypothetical protein